MWGVPLLCEPLGDVVINTGSHPQLDSFTLSGANGFALANCPPAMRSASASVSPDGGMQYVVQCPGGQIIVERKIDGQLNGYAQPGYVGDTDLALLRAFEVVSKLAES